MMLINGYVNTSFDETICARFQQSKAAACYASKNLSFVFVSAEQSLNVSAMS